MVLVAAEEDDDTPLLLEAMLICEDLALAVTSSLQVLLSSTTFLLSFQTFDSSPKE